MKNLLWAKRNDFELTNIGRFEHSFVEKIKHVLVFLIGWIFIITLIANGRVIITIIIIGVSNAAEFEKCKIKVFAKTPLLLEDFFVLYRVVLGDHVGCEEALSWSKVHPRLVANYGRIGLIVVEEAALEIDERIGWRLKIEQTFVRVWNFGTLKFFLFWFINFLNFIL